MAGISADGMSRETDYSSFEYEHIRFAASVDGTDDDSRTIQTLDVDVLDGSGGLDANEVAELVYFRRELSIVPSQFQDSAPVQQGAITGSVAFGVNLDSRTDLPGDQANGRTQATELDTAGVNNDTVTGLSFSTTKDEVFDAGSVIYETSYEDEANGAGGGASSQRSERELELRSMLGAGPVLDSGDNLSLVGDIRKDNSEIGRVELRYDVHAVYDIATVDDAGRRFGIPQ